MPDSRLPKKTPQLSMSTTAASVTTLQHACDSNRSSLQTSHGVTGAIARFSCQPNSRSCWMKEHLLYRVEEAWGVCSPKLVLFQLLVLDSPLVAVAAVYKQLLLIPLHAASCSSCSKLAPVHIGALHSWELISCESPRKGHPSGGASR